MVNTFSSCKPLLLTRYPPVNLGVAIFFKANPCTMTMCSKSQIGNECIQSKKFYYNIYLLSK